MRITDNTSKRILTIITVILLNLISVNIMIFLGVPFFLDTWATSLGVMTAGFWAGAVGGFIYNIIQGALVWDGAWQWGFANIWIAIATFYLFKKGYIDINKPGKTLAAGLLVGLTSSIITSAIAIIFFAGLPTYEGTAASFNAFLAATNSVPVASFLQHLVSDLGDKTVSIFIAAIVFSSIPDKWKILSKQNK